MKTIKLLTKPLILDIAFYIHLTFGFMIASFIAVYFSIDHLKVAIVWSIIFIILLIEKTNRMFNK